MSRERPSIIGKIKKIVPASELGAKGHDEVAIIQKDDGTRAQMPLVPDHQFSLGDTVQAISQTEEFPSGGSRTTYTIELTL